MQMNKHTGLALLLIAFGVLILFNGIGFGVGKLISYIIPIVVMYLGYIGIKQGKTLIGWSLFIIGFFILLGKFSGLLGLIVSIGLIVFGLSMLKKKSKVY